MKKISLLFWIVCSIYASEPTNPVQALIDKSQNAIDVYNQGVLALHSGLSEQSAEIAALGSKKYPHSILMRLLLSQTELLRYQLHENYLDSTTPDELLDKKLKTLELALEYVQQAKDLLAEQEKKLKVDRYLFYFQKIYRLEAQVPHRNGRYRLCDPSSFFV